jgi:hypothetical protein
MRKITSTLIATVLLLASAYSQKSYVRKFPDRYELDIPTEWITTPKLIRASRTYYQRPWMY